MDFAKIQEELLRDEGLRLKPYKDSVGKLSIGVGRNLDDVGITHAEAMYLLSNDISEALNGVLNLLDPEVWGNLSDNRRRVLVNMAFNLGIPRLSTFKKMLAAVKDQDYVLAAREMLNSKWADQVGARAARLAERMAEG